MSWRALVAPGAQTSQSSPTRPAPSFYTGSGLWCYFLVFIKRVLSALFIWRLDFYQDSRIVSENVLQKHSPLRLYNTVGEALSCGLEEGKPAKRSSRSLSLNTAHHNAQWRFELFDDPESVPTEALTNAKESSEQFEQFGEPCTVPMSWQMPINQTKRYSEKDLPIYTNFKYPFPGRLTNISTYISRKNNPTCVYKSRFTLPDQWCEEEFTNEHDLVLILHGAGPGVEVFANGQRLGYHTDSMTEHEYLLPVDIVSRTVGEAHTLSLRIFKYCSGSYLEDQDQWWLTGIHRDVELQLRPRAACLWDMDVRASYSAARIVVNCAVSLDGETHERSPFAVRATLYDDPSSPMETMVLPINVIPKAAPDETKFEMLYLGEDRRRAVAGGFMFVVPKERIVPWTAETPHLYSLVIELIRLPSEAEAEVVVQVEIVRVGFRDVHRNPEKHGQFEVNGKRVVFRGVNRHEFNAHTGKVISEESMVADILQMKRHNFNAVRNSHYPCHHRWYELCDYYGLYVIDESNIESHGFVLGGAVSLIQFDPHFRDAFLHRSYAMVLRSRNHSSIVCWSLGNESGFGPNSYDCSRLIRALDDERLVVYEGGTKAGVPLILGDGRNSVSEFIFPMYHTPELIHSYEEESKLRQAPVVLCEYAHCMGNSGGGLHLYWDLFWRGGVWQGGFIWDWVDQGIAFTHPPGTTSSGTPHNPNPGPPASSSTQNLVQNSSAGKINTPRGATAHMDLGNRTDSSGSMVSRTKQRRSSSVNLLSPHREGELCVTKERLLDISFQGRGWLYGGDFGETSGTLDAQFCCNGVVFPDRSPKPVLFEAKYLMQPFQFVLEHVQDDVVELTVVARYNPELPLEVLWTLTGEEASQNAAQGLFVLTEFVAEENGRLKATARIELKAIVASPASVTSPKPDAQPSGDSLLSHLRVSARLRAAVSWAKQGHEVAFDVFELVRNVHGSYSRALPPSPAQILPPLSAATIEETSSVTMREVDGTHQVVFHCANYDARMDWRTGALVSYRGKDGIERLGGPSLLPCFYRACLDNDLGGAEVHIKSKFIRWLLSPDLWSYAGRWRTLGLQEYDETKVWPVVKVEKTSGNIATVVREDKNFRVHTVIRFLDQGIRANCSVEWIGGYIRMLDSLPRVGTFLEIAPQLARVSYCGRGPFENYADRKRGAAMGVYSQTADDFHVPYVFPSESGGRSDVRWMVLEDLSQTGTGAGLAVAYSCMDEPEWSMDEENRLGNSSEMFKRPAGTRGAQVHISRFRTAQIDKARHQYELTRDLNDWRSQSLKVIVDTAHMGVGGDVSWFPSVHSPFKVKFFDHKTNQGSKWTYQLDLDIVNSSDEDLDEQRRRAEQLNSVRSSRGSM